MEKSALKIFKDKLAEGGYKNLGGARKAIGKLSMSDKDKDKARKIAEKHFGEEGSPAPKKAKKKATKKTAAKKTATKRGPKKAAKKASSKKTATRKTRTKSSTAQPRSSVGEAIQQINHTLTNMGLAQQLGAPREDVAEGARKAQALLTGIIDRIIEEQAWTPEQQKAVESFEKAVKATVTHGNNGMSEGAPALHQDTPPAPPAPSA